jgi:hypothetical protein
VRGADHQRGRGPHTGAAGAHRERAEEHGPRDREEQADRERPVEETLHMVAEEESRGAGGESGDHDEKEEPGQRPAAPPDEGDQRGEGPSPEVEEHGERGAEMGRHLEGHSRHGGVEQVLPQHEVARRGDGQELREPLEGSEQRGLGGGHLVSVREGAVRDMGGAAPENEGAFCARSPVP